MTVQRMLFTLRGFTRWLARQGHLGADPCDAEMLQAMSRDERRPRALAPEEIEAMAAAAGEGPSGRQRMFWPRRDVAMFAFLAGTGARAQVTTPAGAMAHAFQHSYGVTLALRGFVARPDIPALTNPA